MASDLIRILETVRFGEDFELDLRANELRRSGRVLKLERIPMELLLLLVEQRDSIVTREQIVERIWGPGVFLDTDNSTRGAVRKIRQVLKDNPERPRYIQTVTGKGYRFIAPVIEPALPVANQPPSTGEPRPLTSPAGEQPARKSSRRPPALVLAIALALTAALGIWLFWSRTRPHAQQVGGRMMLAVLPFANLTALRANISETSSPSTITVGAEKDSHLHEHDQW